ncbi:unnamed protein product [Clavelina lepadiformis]|uniref:Uncharacterized protein n=1 Tax=Clavelina lepadiformis TaxID=159417 RepID=A0ABP0GPX1_CLALP
MEGEIDEPPPLTSAEDKIYNYADDPDNDSLHGSIIPTTTSPVETYSAEDFTISQSQTTFNESYQTQTNYWEPPKDHNNHQLQSEKSSAPRTASTILPVETMVGGLDDDEDIRAVSRKILSGPTASPLRGISLRNDPDGPDKYKRRSAFTWLKRWLKSRMLRGRSYHDGRALPRRTVVILLIGLLALLTFIVFATKVGRRSSSANDPNFDPHFNPNIHIAQGRVLDPDGNAALDVVDPLQAVQPVAGGV